MGSESRAVVAQFIKGAGGRLELWSVTCMEEKRDHSGKTYVSRDYYDVETSRRYGYIFHMSGAGGGRKRISVDSPYFVSGNVGIAEKPNRLCCWPVDKTGRRTRAIRKRNRTRRLTTLPEYFDLQPGEDLLTWLEHTAINQEAVFCSECKDFFPEDSTCEHIWWCENDGQWSTPGERCNHVGLDCYGDPVLPSPQDTEESR
jgi:hypothetical protein